jgi:hypothetical protein
MGGHRGTRETIIQRDRDRGRGNAGAASQVGRVVSNRVGGKRRRGMRVDRDTRKGYTAKRKRGVEEIIAIVDVSGA